MGAIAVCAIEHAREPSEQIPKHVAHHNSDSLSRQPLLALPDSTAREN